MVSSHDVSPAEPDREYWARPKLEPYMVKLKDPDACTLLNDAALIVLAS